MTGDLTALAAALKDSFGNKGHLLEAHGELTLEIPSESLLMIMEQLKEDPALRFEQCLDVCGIDYLEYGVVQWDTHTEMGGGYSRGVDPLECPAILKKPRFQVAYHLLSLTHNHRVCVKTVAHGEPPTVPSVVGIWNSANWFEREAFDLFGIVFVGHPDLRRILTDYGFMGHPFRKDFPLIGTVEPRYDAAQGRVINEPVSIEPRTLVPKTIREAH